MNVNPITLFSQKQIQCKRISFAKNQDAKITKPQSALSHKNANNTVSAAKMLPVLAAMAGLTTLSSCSEQYENFHDLDKTQTTCLKELNDMNNLASVNEKTFVLTSHKDSLVKENDDYKYSRIRIKSPDKTTIFGDITDKKDGKRVSFINVYDKDNNLVSTTLKDKKTGEKFYINYENAFVREIRDKNGNKINDANMDILFGLIWLTVNALTIGGIVFNRRKMTDADVPFIEPPPQQD